MSKDLKNFFTSALIMEAENDKAGLLRLIASSTMIARSFADSAAVERKKAAASSSGVDEDLIEMDAKKKKNNKKKRVHEPFPSMPLPNLSMDSKNVIIRPIKKIQVNHV
jgi:hypothetical protein